MKKKVVIILVCLCLVALGAVFFTACGEDENSVHTQYSYYSFTYDDSLKGLVLDVSTASRLPSGEITLPAESYYYADGVDGGQKDHAEAKPVVKIADGAFERCGGITAVTIPSSYFYLGESSFASCTSLVSVAMSVNVTSFPSQVFSGCNSLKTMTGAATISEAGDNAFFSCLALRSTEFAWKDDFRIGERAFFYTISMSTIDLTKASKVGGRAFEGWQAAQRITVGSDYGWADDWKAGCNATIVK